jgi:dihydrofolate reductase
VVEGPNDRGGDVRRLVVTENITLDGVIDAAEGWFLPSGASDADESDQLAVVQEQAVASDAFLTGRVTFEALRGFWPQQVHDRTGISEHLDRVAKYVVSTTMTDPQWANSTVLAGPLVDEISALKQQPGKDIVVTGSITLVHELIPSGLIDEYRLFVFPVALGRGRRLFEGATGLPRLRLLDTQPVRSGVVLLRYAADSSATA